MPGPSGSGTRSGRDRSRLLRRALVFACAVFGVLAAIALAGTGGIGGSVKASGPGPPNILFIVTDDERLDGMTVMPKTLQWFQDQGMTFPQAYSTTPLCCPARSTIFSGQYVHNTGVRTNSSGVWFDPRHSMQRYLHDAGYQTGLYGKYFNAWSDIRNPPYFDKFVEFDAGYFNYRVNDNGVLRQIQQYSTNYIRDKALSFVNSAEADDSRPWFLYLGLYAPHLPSTPDTQYANASVPPFQPSPSTWEADRSDKPAYVQNYQLDQQEIIDQQQQGLRSLLSVDDAVDALMQNLTANGEADNTLAVFVSDNGYMFGEHNIDAKNRPYLDSIRVPMYMRWPGQVPVGATDSRLTALVDLAPTVLSATGLSSTVPMDGRNLLDPSWQRDRMLTEFTYQGDVPTWVSLVTAGSQYTEYFSRDDPNSVYDREYYDLGADPYELDNLLSDSSSANDPSTAALSAQIAQDRYCVGTTCP
jgi:arylsulfatase A-like enzyme